MSTTLLFAVCAALVFSPLLIEVVRVLGRAGSGVVRASRSADERRDISIPTTERGVEQSVRDQLYARDPRWQRLEVEPAPPRTARARPRWPATRLRRPLRVIGRPADAADVQAEEGSDDVRAA
jgi:hypothetical protein